MPHLPPRILPAIAVIILVVFVGTVSTVGYTYYSYTESGEVPSVSPFTRFGQQFRLPQIHSFIDLLGIHHSYALSSRTRVPTKFERQPLPVGKDITYQVLEEANQKAIDNIPVDDTQTIVPVYVRALYMSSWTAATPSRRDGIVNAIINSNGNLNAVVIDIKDDTGKISFLTDDPEVAVYGSMTNRIPDIREFIEELHSHNIYVIGRIAVFQDPYLANQPGYRDYAVQQSNGAVWKDRKGLAWFDPSSQKVWEYIVRIAIMAHGVGFDEINLDYVRFPTDGSGDRVYPQSGTRVKREVIRDFFAYMDEEIRAKRGIPLSADIFGMVTTQYDDMGIGQVLEDIAPYLDAIAPMVYPSHYPKSFHGYANPAEHPYEIITIALAEAQERLEKLPKPRATLRPWLQDFNLGATYTADRVFAQIRASADLGIGSWMMWDASNTYTLPAYRYPIVVKSEVNSEEFTAD